MMKRISPANYLSYNNILYIGDEPKACIAVMEQFRNKLIEIEKKHPLWFNGMITTEPGSLQNHIHYHFEGGMAIFKFKNKDYLPDNIRKECFMACKSLAVYYN